MIKNLYTNYRASFLSFVLAALFCIVNDASAHCDTMSGPVIKAAEKSLQTGDVSYTFIWVRSEDEPEIQNAFQQAMAVRKLNKQAAALADKYFYETVVRLHRASEGVPYTGLKMVEPNLGPAIPAADEALKTGKIDSVIKLETEVIQKGIQKHFQNVISKKNFNHHDIKAGREYVEAYVSYMHYIERIYLAATKSAHGHYPQLGRVDNS